MKASRVNIKMESKNIQNGKVWVEQVAYLRNE